MNNFRILPSRPEVEHEEAHGVFQLLDARVGPLATMFGQNRCL